MDFINNFVCFNEQEIELPDNFNDIIEINNPFVRIKTVGSNVKVKGLKCINDKSYMIFMINDTDNTFILKHDDTTINEKERVQISTASDKTMRSNCYEVGIHSVNKWYFTDINL